MAEGKKVFVINVPDEACTHNKPGRVRGFVGVGKSDLDISAHFCCVDEIFRQMRENGRLPDKYRPYVKKI